jgi:hypothetical protein
MRGGFRNQPKVLRGWEVLVLPADKLEQLKESCNQMVHRHCVLKLFVQPQR